jgi:hypothetical protein
LNREGLEGLPIIYLRNSLSSDLRLVRQPFRQNSSQDLPLLIAVDLFL